MKRGRGRSYYSDLDWFCEDPWAEPEPQASEDDRDDRIPDLWAFNEDEPDDGDRNHEDDWNEDGHDGWGPIRPRRGRSRHIR